MNNPHLPLWDKVIFVDWNGVLSWDPFWKSILTSPSHPLHRRLSGSVNRLFDQNDELVRAWMRGHVNANEVVDVMKVKLDKRFKPDYLARRLVDDCRLMRTSAGLFNILREAQEVALVVLATDNMDCFFEHVRYSKTRRKSRHGTTEFSADDPPAIADTIEIFDDILCSSEIGVLKREDPMQFYGEWMSKRSLDFGDALLLDDVEENCSVFRSAGGAAIQVTTESLSQGLHSLRADVLSWLE